MSLKDVKVGDAVCVTGSGYIELEKRHVTRTTQTQVVLDDESRWLRRGRKVGSDTWSRYYAKPWNEAEHAERLAESHRKELARWVGARAFSSLSMDQLQRIKAIAEEKGA